MSSTEIVWTDVPKTTEEAVTYLKKTPILYTQYEALSKLWKEKFVEFIMGKCSLPLTYDPFFKRIFDPEIHKERLESLISSLLGIQVHIIDELTRENTLMDGETLLIMDLLVRLEDGSLCNVEIQKQPYGFPAERISCYSADLLMRQYTRLKDEKRNTFTYKDIKKVYVIVIYEKTTEIFKAFPENYVHYGEVVFQSGLQLELLQKFCLVALDVFSKTPYPKEKNEQTAWLSLLSTDSLQHAEALLLDYPWLEEIYEEIATLRHRPGEVLGMWSEALRTLDENTLKYLVDEQLERIGEQAEKLEEQAEKLEEQAEKIEEQAEKLEEQAEKIEEQAEKIEEQVKKIGVQAEKIEEQSERIVRQRNELAQKDAEITKLKEMLAEKNK